MSENLSSEERLVILRLNDHERRWYTVDDKRFCLICERIFSGRAIRISAGPGEYSFGCPTEDCPGTFSHWYVYRPTPIRQKQEENGADGADGADREIDFFSDFGRRTRICRPPGRLFASEQAGHVQITSPER